MSRIRSSLPIAPLLAVLLLSGCGKGSDGPAAPASPGTVIVSGEVLAVEDLVPVDGGVTITIDLGEGDTEDLLFPSMFTNPPPSEATVALYDVVRRVVVGDLVQAQGTRSTAGIDLESLAILTVRPPTGEI